MKASINYEKGKKNCNVFLKFCVSGVAAAPRAEETRNDEIVVVLQCAFGKNYNKNIA